MKHFISTRYNPLLFLFFSIVTYSNDIYAFQCKDTTNTLLDSNSGGGNANIYVSLKPQLLPGENLVVDIADSIVCQNTRPATRDDYVALSTGSSYDGVMSNFKGSVHYYGNRFSFPLLSPTSERNFGSAGFEPWQVRIFLTPVSVASGILIKPNDLIARLVLDQRGVNKGTAHDNEQKATFTWNVYATNSVTIPTGGCTITADNVTVTLPDYPGTANVPVSIHCEKDEKLKFFLSGTTADTGKTIFVNQAGVSPAQGVGVQLQRNNSVIPTNTDILIGTVGTSTVDLGLTATYARTMGQVTAGNVQSIIDLTFEYQ